jgi:hypothetical protein
MCKDCEPKLVHQGEGQRHKNWTDSSLSVFCPSDYGLWLHPFAEVKLFFLPCWATPKYFFDHIPKNLAPNMGQILLPQGSQGPLSQRRHDLLPSCCSLREGRSAIPGPTLDPRLRDTQQRGEGTLIKSTSVARATLHRPRWGYFLGGLDILEAVWVWLGLVSDTKQVLTLDEKKALWVKYKKSPVLGDWAFPRETDTTNVKGWVTKIQFQRGRITRE